MNKYRSNIIISIHFLFYILFLANIGCVSSPQYQPQQVQQSKAQQQQKPLPKPVQPEFSVSQFFSGDGGKGMSIAVLAPQSSGLSINQSYLPTLVQKEFVSNFSGYSAISILDWENLDKIYDNLLSGYYSDDAPEGMDLGHLSPTTHIMGGNITRTETGYALQIQITRTSDKMTTASYSGTFTFAELDDLTGIRRASLDLLEKMGVTLKELARTELTGAAAENRITAQTALAQGITAQRRGTEVAALSYFYQAAAYDPSLHEAVNRSSILSADISSGNIGDDIRNDIAWRRQWVDRLTETEQYFDSFNRTESMPYTLFYVSDEIKQGTINYQNETVNLSIETHLHGSGIWTLSTERALQAVWDGLNTTGRKEIWGLGNWPQRGVTNLNAFARRSGNFSAVFELLNDQNEIISRQTLQSGGAWELNWSGRPYINVNADDRKTLTFQNVNANKISDKMTIRVTTVNGTAAEIAARNGVLQIHSITKSEFDRNNRFRFSKGVLLGFSNSNINVGELIIPDAIWGDPVISIGNEAFRNTGLTKVTIPDIVSSIGNSAFEGNQIFTISFSNDTASIGSNAFSGNRASVEGGYGVILSEDGKSLVIVSYKGIPNVKIPQKIQGMPVSAISTGAFRNCELVSVVIPEGVTSIGDDAFRDNKLTSVIIPNSVQSIGNGAFYQNYRPSDYTAVTISITIGSNVSMTKDSIYLRSIISFRESGDVEFLEENFFNFYNDNGKKGGIYTYIVPNIFRIPKVPVGSSKIYVNKNFNYWKHNQS